MTEEKRAPTLQGWAVPEMSSGALSPRASPLRALPPCTSQCAANTPSPLTSETFSGLETCHTQDVRQEGGNLGRFKGRGSAWAAVHVAYQSGTDSEQSSAWLIGAKWPLLSNCRVLKGLEPLK